MERRKHGGGIIITRRRKKMMDRRNPMKAWMRRMDTGNLGAGKIGPGQEQMQGGQIGTGTKKGGGGRTRKQGGMKWMEIRNGRKTREGGMNKIDNMKKRIGITQKNRSRRRKKGGGVMRTRTRVVSALEISTITGIPERDL